MKNVLPAVHKPMVFDEQTAQLAFLTIEKHLQQRHKPLGISTLASANEFTAFFKNNPIPLEKSQSESVKIKKFSVLYPP